jgi:hypothetical protein
MTPIQLEQVVDCVGATVRNDERQPTSDAPHAQPESSRWTDLPSTTLEARSRAAWEVLSFWRQGRGVGKGGATIA